MVRGKRINYDPIKDKPKPLHKDTDLGYFSIEIIKAAMQSPNVKSSQNETPKSFIGFCIGLAEELIKQLDEKIK